MGTLLVFLFLSFQNKTQEIHFEGWIKYKHEIVLKNTEIDSTRLKEFVGESSTLYFKEGSFLNSYDGGYLIKNFYRKDDNKIYYKRRNNDTTYWVDCGKPGDEVVGFEFTPKKEKILGIVCDELIIYYKDRIVTDYYNSDLFSINPDWFKSYKLDGQDQIDQKEKAVSIKNKTEYANFIVMRTAVSFSNETVDGKIFNLSSEEILIEQE